MPPFQGKVNASDDIFSSSSPPSSPETDVVIRKAPTIPPRSSMLPPPRPRTSSGSSTGGNGSPAVSPNVMMRKSVPPRHNSPLTPISNISNNNRQRASTWSDTTSTNSTSAETSTSDHYRKDDDNQIQELEQKIQIYLKKYGSKHPFLSALYNKLGNMQFREGNLDAATASYKSAVQYSMDNEQLGSAYLNLGTVYWRTGVLDEAIHFLKQALSVDELLHRGHQNSKVAASVFHQLGVCHALSKDFNNALSNLRQACEIRKQLYGTKDVSVAQTLDSIGKIYLLQNKYVDALSYHQQALSILRENNANSDTISTTLQNMVNVHIQQGQLTSALTVLQEICKLQKNTIHLSKQKEAQYNHNLQLMSKLMEDINNTSSESSSRT